MLNLCVLIRSFKKTQRFLKKNNYDISHKVVPAWNYCRIPAQQGIFASWWDAAAEYDSCALYPGRARALARSLQRELSCHRAGERAVTRVTELFRSDCSNCMPISWSIQVELVLSRKFETVMHFILFLRDFKHALTWDFVNSTRQTPVIWLRVTHICTWLSESRGNISTSRHF